MGVVGISTFNSYIGGPGSTITLRQIKIQSIYIKDHKFNTGDELIYSSSGESPIKVTRDIIPNEFSLEDESTVYAVNLGKDYVGFQLVLSLLEVMETILGWEQILSQLCYILQIWIR